MILIEFVRQPNGKEGRSRLGGFQNAAAFDALGAGFNLLVRLPNECMNHLEVGLEQAWRDGSHVLTDAAGFFRLTAPEDRISTNLTFTANFTTSRHNWFAPFL